MNDKQKISISIGSWITALVVIAIAYVLSQVKDLILVIIASVVIASAIEPVTVWAKRRNIPRLPMVILVYVFSALVLAGLFYFLLLPLLGDMSSFIRTLTIYSNSVTSGGILSEMFQTQNLFGGLNTPVIIRELSSYLNILSDFISRGVFSSLTLIFGGIMNFVLILILSFYLVVQEDGVSKFLKIIVPLKHEQYAVGLWRGSQIKIGRWMQGQLVSSILVMFLVYIGLIIIGVPHALLLAVLAGVFELIPLFGATLAAIPALFIAYISGGLSVTLFVAGLYIVVQQLEGNVIYPLVVNKVVGVPPIISILALVVGGTLAGFLGVLVSVPVAAAIMEFLSDLEERKERKAVQTPGT